MNYILQNKNLDKNRVFILQKSELEKRLDPYYYLPEFKNLEEKLKKLPNKRLSQISSKIFSGSTPLSKGDAYTEDKENGIPFVRSGDFNINGSIDFENLVYLKPEIHEKMLASSKLKENDLLFAIVGATIGKVGVYKSSKEANINQAICAVRLNEDENIDYCNAYFQSSIGQKLIDRIKRPVARANVNLDEIARLQVILPDTEIQSKIVEIFNQSLEKKKQLEAQAEQLLASIDDYLLGELGITLPDENTVNEVINSYSFDLNRQNSIVKKGRLFLTKFSEIGGGRFDPRYYQKHFLKFYDKIKQKFPVKKLKDITFYIGSGSTPTSGGEAYASNIDGIPFIRITNLKNDTIDLTDVLYIKREIHETTLKRTQLNSGDLLLSMAGTIGLTIVVPDFIKEANINQALARIILDNSVDNIFVKEILNSIIGKTQMNRLSRPAVQANINFDEIGALLIPVPPLEKQEKIANYIQTIRQNANELKTNAKQVLQQAKAEIEMQILGK